MSSYIGALTNQNRPIRLTGTSTATVSGTTNIYVTLPLGPSHGLLQKIRVVGSASFSELSVSVLTDGALYRGNSSSGLYLQASQNDTSSGVTTVSLDFDGTYVEDANRVGCLYLLLSSATAFTTGTIFTVFADIIQTEPYSSREEEITPWASNHGYKALYLPYGEDVAQDITQDALMNGNPYLLGSTNLNMPFTVLNGASDSLFIGYTVPFTKFYVTVPVNPVAQANGNTLSCSYWNGSTWANADTVYDNTSDGQDSTPSTMSYSGVISFPSLSGWQPTDLSSDPLSIAINNVEAGNGQSALVGFAYNPPRYWIMIQINEPTIPVQATSIRILK